MAAGDVNPKRVGGPTVLGTSTTTIVSAVPTSHQYTIKQVAITNTTGTDRWFTLAIGTAATAANCLIFRLPITAYDTIIWDTALVLEATETLQGLCDSASSVNVTATGWDKEL